MWWHATSPVGKLLRLPLALVPRDAVMPVLRGPNRGLRWIARSTPHGAWLGLLEADKLRLFARHLEPGMEVWDVGANVGLYTLAAARAVGPRGGVAAFEPMEANLAFLRRHLELNDLGRVRVVDKAVSDRHGTLRMAEGDSPSEFHADPEGSFEVEAIPLDAWARDTAAPAPSVIKIDVEGAEGAVLRGAEETLATARPVLFLALHGDEARRECREVLDRRGYRVRSLEPAPPEESCEWLAVPAEADP